MASGNGLPVEIDDLVLEARSDLESQLTQFRAVWQREISDRQPSSGESSARESPLLGFDIIGSNAFEVQLAKLPKVERAKLLFKEGIKAEERGQVNDAVDLYRRAIQLVPDVENMIDYMPSTTSRRRMESESSLEGSGVEGDDDLDLIYKFQRFQLETETICQPQWEQRSAHISVLPVEVLMYILKWVVTNDLDMLALENFSLVCRGFYLCARDEELWRKACLKIWSVNTGSCKKFGGWRQMYIERPHLRYNGCYISKASYIRHGEKTLDNFYRPWHTVEYYRYVHFFPEGTILMLTSPDNPVKILHKLRQRAARTQGTLKGLYRMTDNKVTAVLRRVKTDYSTSGYTRYKRRLQNINQNEPEMTFHMEFEVCHAGSRKYAQLVWTHYSVHQLKRATGEESVAEFDLNNKTYPPLYFSRVKSYTASTDGPLQ